jgi:hypothetical protein
MIKRRRNFSVVALVTVTIFAPQGARAQFAQQGPKLVGVGAVVRIQKELVGFGIPTHVEQGCSVALSGEGIHRHFGHAAIIG